MAFSPWSKTVDNPRYVHTAPPAPAAQVFDQPLPRTLRYRWAVGVTHYPRDPATLADTLDSLVKAGFGNPIVFCDCPDDCQIPPEHRARAVVRPQRLGAWPNWLLAFTELVQRDPEADLFAMFQDDVSVARGAREYVDSLPIPTDCGCLSLYASAKLSGGHAGRFLASQKGWGTVGALALIFPRLSALELLASSHAQRHRYTEFGLHAIDALVGLWCKHVGRPFYVHSPSLAQHTGDVSTIHAGAVNDGQRRATDWANSVPREWFGLETTRIEQYSLTVILAVCAETVPDGAGDNLRRAINSLRSQTGLTMVHLIVCVYGGVTHETRKVLREFGGQIAMHASAQQTPGAAAIEASGMVETDMWTVATSVDTYPRTFARDLLLNAASGDNDAIDKINYRSVIAHL